MYYMYTYPFHFELFYNTSTYSKLKYYKNCYTLKKMTKNTIRISSY